MTTLDRNKRNEYRKRNYKQTQLYEPRGWTDQEEELVMAHRVTDRELSKMLERSVQAIQIRRCRLKQEMEDGTREEI